MPPADDPASAVPENNLSTTEQINAQMLLQADKAFQENFDLGEYRVTRLSICQGTTKEIAQQLDGYSLGQIISSVSREVLSKKGPPPWLKAKGVANPTPCHYLPVVIVMKLPTEYTEWVPKNEQKEGESPIAFKSLDPKNERVLNGTYKSKGGRFDPGPNNSAPPITAGINYMVLPFDEETKLIKEGFAVNTFARTSYPTGTLLTTQIQNRRAQKVFPWNTVYYLYTTPKPTKKGITQIWQVAYGGLVKDICPDLQSMAVQMAVDLSNPETGRTMMETILNAVELTTDHDEDATPHGDGALDAELAGAGSTEADEAFGDGTKQAF